MTMPGVTGKKEQCRPKWIQGNSGFPERGYDRASFLAAWGSSGCPAEEHVRESDNLETM